MIPRMVRPAATLALVAAMAAPAAAQEDRTLERARTEMGELRYEDALRTLNKGLKAGDNGPAATAEIYLLLGEVRASLGQKREAVDSFELALAIDQALDLRKGLSPKIREPFATARRAMRGKKPIAVAHRILTSEPPVIAVLTQSDPLRMLVGVRIVYWTGRDKERTLSVAAKERIDLELHRGVTGFVVSGVDSHGNRIVELGSRQAPLTLDVDSGGRGTAGAAKSDGDVERAAEDPEDVAARAGEGATGATAAPASDTTTVESTASDGPPIYAHWMVWGGVAVGLGAAGTWAGLTARSAVGELDDIRTSDFEVEYSAAEAIADRAESRALIANVTFGIAGACAIVSGYLFWRHGRSGSAGSERAVVAPLVGRDQAGITAGVRF